MLEARQVFCPFERVFQETTWTMQTVPGVGPCLCVFAGGDAAARCTAGKNKTDGDRARLAGKGVVHVRRRVVARVAGMTMLRFCRLWWFRVDGGTVPYDLIMFKVSHDSS